MSVVERFTVAGKELVKRIEELVRRGDARRICLIQDEERSLEIPVFGDPAAPATVLGAPVLAAIAAFGSMVDKCTVEVEKQYPGSGPEKH